MAISSIILFKHFAEDIVVAFHFAYLPMCAWSCKAKVDAEQSRGLLEETPEGAIHITDNVAGKAERNQPSYREDVPNMLGVTALASTHHVQKRGDIDHSQEQVCV